MVDIKWIGSDNYVAGNYKKVGFILHWMAGYLPGTDAMFRPGGSVDYATHYGIGSPDGWGTTLEVHQYVADKDRSFGSYNADADARGLSVEIENDRRAPYPGKPTPAVHELVAQFLAHKAIQHDMRINGVAQLVLGDFPDHRFYQRSIPQFGVDFNVTTHRSMALKDCPGTTDVAWIVARANEIIRGGGVQQRPLTLWEKEDKENDMSLFLVKINDGEKRYGGGMLFAVTGPDYWVEVTNNIEAGNVLAARFGNAANLTYAQWDAFKAEATRNRG